jgi:hypothetical protein
MEAEVGEDALPLDSKLCHEYEVYGICLRTSFPLPLPGRSSADLVGIEIQVESAGYFSDRIRGARLRPSPWRNFFYAHFESGSSYVRWNGVGEFLVSSDGRSISCRRFDEAPLESFQVYLLGQAISFALVKGGFEPLHATCVVIEGKAVALLGDSGYGKSSLAACFLEAGHRLLTDDLLVVREVPGGFQAFPGPPRIKLFSEMARRFLGGSVSGVPMNSGTRKLIMPLEPARVYADAAPLEAIYAIAAPEDAAQDRTARIEGVASRDAFVLLMNNVFNYVIVDSQRLNRQFGAVAGLAARTPMRKVYYPRQADALPWVRDAIVADLHAM